MTDLTQKVKYVVDVDLAPLNAMKTALDAAEKAAKDLGAALDKLAGANVKGMRQLGGTVQALGTRLGKFATAADPAGQAMMRLKAAMEGVAPAASAVTVTTKEQTAATVVSGKAVEETTKRVHDWRLSMLKFYGSFHAIRYTLVNMFAGIREGAQQVDLDNTLTKQFAGFRKEIERAQAATAGTVGRGQLTRSFALMSSFGIPMDKFAENMALVQKMAIRTGQSADFLADSFARGISRLSPLILDNLGIQVSLTDANNAYANSIGKVVGDLTKQEQVTALLNQVLEKLEKNTKGINIATESAAGSVSRFETFVSDAWLKIKEMGGDGIRGFDLLGESARTSVARTATWKQVTADAAASVYEFFGSRGLLTEGLVKARVEANGLADALKYMSLNEDIADLFGNQTEYGSYNFFTGESTGRGGIFAPLLGTTSGLVNSVSDQARAAFRAFQDTWGEEVASGAVDPSLLGNVLGRPDIIAGAISDIFSQSYDDSLFTIERLSSVFSNVLSEQERAALSAQVFKDYYERTGQVIDRLWASMKKGDSIVTLLVRNNSLFVDQWEVANAQATEAFAKASAWAATNKQISDIYVMANQALSIQLEWGQRIYELRKGALLSDLQAADVERERQDTLKKIADVVEKAEGRELNNTEKLNVIKLKGHLLELDNKRELARAAIAMDAAMIASYKEKTKEQIKADAERLMAFSEAMKAMSEALKVVSTDAAQKHLEIAIDLENRAKKLMEMANAGGGGGGGGSRDRYGRSDRGSESRLKDILSVQNALSARRDEINKQLDDLNALRSNLRRELVEDVTGVRAGDALAEVRKRLYELSKQYGATEFERYLQDRFGGEFKAEILEAADAVDAITDAFDRLIKVAEGLKSVSDVLGEFRKGMSSIHGDLFGGEFISMVDDLGSAFDNLAEIQIKNAEATDKSHNAYNNVLGGIGAMRAFTANLIKDRKDQAKVEMLMQAAAAWAAWAIPDPVKAVGHTTAALLYGAVGFGAIKLPSGKPKSTTPRESRGSGAGEAKRPDIHIHIAGNVVQTEAERGVMAQAAIQEARRRGML